MTPYADVVREGDIIIDAINPAKHRKFTIDFSWKKGHTLVLGYFAVNGKNLKMLKIVRHQKLRQDRNPIVSGVGGIVHRIAIVLTKLNKPGVFNSPFLRICDRKN